MKVGELIANYRRRQMADRLSHLALRTPPAETMGIYYCHRAGHSYHHISAFFGVPVASVKMHIARTLLAIMRELDK